MKRHYLGLLCAAGLLAAGAAADAAEDVFTPLTAVPFNPVTTPVPGTDGRWHFVYELELTNTRSVPATLEQVDVVGVKPADALATFDPPSFPGRLKQLDNRPAENAEIELNATRLFLINIAMERQDIPARLSHMLDLKGAGLNATDPNPAKLRYQAATLNVTRDLPNVHPPLSGKGWLAINGCCEPGVHRSTALPVNGKLHFAQRFAIDWVRLDEQGRLRNGPVDRVESYTAYGATIHAVADGTVVSTLDALPNQVPGSLPDPGTITLANVDGNHVVLDIGNGYYAFYAHMQPGSVQVRVGQKIRAGTVLGLLGNSGNTSAPHLHFHIMDGESVLGSEGVPYVFDRFELAGNIPDAAVPADMGGNFSQFLRPTPQSRTEQFPLDTDVIDFGQ
ncbi:M23 family metallopeptidase [Geminicoccus harenae]|uniref:M23 family metallopeptidase n=1 Tax=Geminicoccus harenae TaxID=2498453 RepID=UPI00168B7323|nr:M23 family metallopeptidase [Geminicoccus harenae]